MVMKKIDGINNSKRWALSSDTGDKENVRGSRTDKRNGLF